MSLILIGGANKAKGAKEKARQAGQAVSKVLKKIATGIKTLFKFVMSHPYLALGIAIIIAIIITILWVATEKDQLKKAWEKTKDFFSGLDVSTITVSEKKAKDLFESTGSLLYTTDDQLDKIATDYLDYIKNVNKTKYKILSKKYKNGNTSLSLESGAANINDSKTIYKHILSAEKYNFNEINWQAYTRVNLLNNEVPSGDLDMKLDSDSELQYPEYLGDLGGVSEVDFYVNKVFPYLQSWTIPISMIGGTTNGGLSGTSEEAEVKTSASEGYNSRFAYEIMISGYHKIDFDRYETWMREIVEQYRSYDETITHGTVTRTCTTYTREVPAPTEDDPDNTVTQTAGPVCVDSDIAYGTGTTTPIVEYPTGYSGELASGYYNIEKYVNDTYGSSYTKKTNGSLSVNDLGDTSIYQYDITKFRGFDFKFDKEYALDPYDITLQQIAANETSTPYNTEKVYEGTSASGSVYSAKNQQPPDWASGATTSVTTSTVNVTKKAQNGETVDVDRTWQDNLSLASSDSGNYTVDDLKSFIGVTTLPSYEQLVYDNLVKDNELNIIDIINADPNIYSKYLKKGGNISKYRGYSREYLEVSYYLLKENLIDLSREHGISYMWGSTLVPNMGMAVTGSGMEGSSLNVGSLQLVAPFSAELIKSGSLHIQDGYMGNGSYGYVNHTGIDISYSTSKADTSRCTDGRPLVECAYIKGPAIYNMQTGTLYSVTYSECNNHYNTGICHDIESRYPSRNSNLIMKNSVGATSVTILQPDGTKTVYYHLYPDFNFYNELASHIGETIPIGAFLGYMGNTGNSTGLHLHLENGTVLWQKNGRQTLALLNSGINNTTGNKVDVTGGGIPGVPGGTTVDTGSLSGMSTGSSISTDKYKSAYKYKDIAKKWADYYGLDYNLVIAMIAQESGGDPTLKGKGSYGLMQWQYNSNGTTCKTTNSDGISEKITGITVDNLRAKGPDFQIQVGCAELKSKMNSIGGYTLLGLQAYNYGACGLQRVVHYTLTGSAGAKGCTDIPTKEIKEYGATGDKKWMDYRYIYQTIYPSDWGDKKYVENVLQYYNPNG